MKRISIKLKTLLMVLTMSLGGLCAATDGNQKDLVVLLPINHLCEPGKQISLRVQIPKGYKPLQDMASFAATGLGEFIPVSDTDPYNWSEIFTVQTMPGKGIKASQGVAHIQQMIAGQSSEMEVLSSTNKDMGSYQVASALIRYKTSKRQELCYVQYMSGPMDLSGFQFSVPVIGKQGEAEARKKIERMKNNKAIIDIIKS